MTKIEVPKKAHLGDSVACWNYYCVDDGILVTVLLKDGTAVQIHDTEEVRVVEVSDTHALSVVDNVIEIVKR